METRSHEQRKGLLALIGGLATVSLIFTGLVPAHALTGGKAASGDATKSIARIEVPIQETYDDATPVSPLLEKPEKKTYQCPSGYSAGPDVTVVETTTCYKTEKATDPGSGYSCPAYAHQVGSGPITADTDCESSKSAEVASTEAAVYRCPTGYENGKSGALTADGVCVRPGGKATRNKIKVCTGVLLDNQTILGLQSCLIAGDPYKMVMGNDKDIKSLSMGKDTISQKVLGAAKITFGTDTLPGADNTYWANTILPDTSTQMARIRLDRPVPTSIGAPVKKANSLVSINNDLKVYGWQEDPGTPKLEVKQVEAGLPYLVTSLTPEPDDEPVQQNWDDYMRTHSGFRKRNGVQVADRNVRKGFALKDTNMSENDLGAPVFNNAGELAGIYLGASMFIDAGEARATKFIFDNAGNPAGEVAAPPLQLNPYKAYKQMQDMLCQIGNVEATGRVELEGEDKVLEGGDTYAGLKIGRWEGGSLKEETIYAYTQGLTCGDKSKKGELTVKPSSIGSALRWADQINSDVQAAIDDLDHRLNQAITARDTAVKERQDYDRAVEIVKQGLDGFNPDSYDSCRKLNGANENSQVTCLTSGGNNLPAQIISGLKSDSNEVVIPSYEVKVKGTESVAQAPAILSGSTIQSWLEETSDVLVARAKRKTENAAREQTKADNLEKENQKKNLLESYRSAVNNQLKKTMEGAVGVIDPAQQQWKADWDAKYDQFDKDYKEYFSLINEIDNQHIAYIQARDYVAGNCGEPIAPEKQQACTKNLADRENAKRDRDAAIAKARDNKFKDWTPAIPASLQDDTRLGNDIVPKMAPYAPEHEATKTKIEEATKQLPKYVLYAHHMDQVLQSVLGDLQAKGFKDQATIDSIASKIKSRLLEGTRAENVALAAVSYTTIQSEELEKLLQKVPESLRPFAKDKILAAAAARRETSKALETIRDAKVTLDNLAKQAPQANSTDKALQYDKESQEALEQATNSLNTAQQNRETIRTLKDEIQDMIDGKIADPTKPGEKPMTPAERAKAEQERKRQEAEAKREADRKKAEIARQEAEAKRKADAEAKKAEANAKKDEARLAKALSANTMRADGDNRTLTSIAAWKRGHFPGDTVLIVDGKVAADGISATPLAAALQAPILLTTWQTGLEPAIIDQLKASDKKRIILVGGKTNISPNDHFELSEAGIEVERIAGPDRFSTAVAVNQAAEQKLGAKPGQPLEVFIGDGIGFPDALAAGAAAGRNKGVMALSKGNTLDPHIRNYLAQLGASRPLRITAVGGPAVRAVRNNPWPANMSVTIKPIIGGDRYETASLLAAQLEGTQGVVLASGENFADALPGGALAADQNSALVLTKAKDLPRSSYETLRRQGAEQTIVMGGEKAINRKVAELINGAKVDDLTKVEGTLAERAKLQRQKAAAEAQAKTDAIDLVKQQMLDQLKKNPGGFDAWVKKNFGFLDAAQLAELLKKK